MNNAGRGPPGPPGQNSDQYALSLLVNAAEGRDSPRQRMGADSRFGDQGGFNLRGLGSNQFGGDTSLEEQLLLQQQGFGGGNNGAILNQLRDRNLLSQQQQIAALLGLGGSSGGGGGGGGLGLGGSGGNDNSWNPEMRHALAAAQFRQNQAATSFTQADILALSRSGALSGLLGSNGGGGGGGGGSNSYLGSSLGSGAYGSSGVGAFSGGNSGDFPGTHSSFQAELEGLHRLEELNRRQRLLATSSEAPRPGLDRAQGLVRDQQQQQQLQQQQQQQQPAPPPPLPPTSQQLEKQGSEHPLEIESSPKLSAEEAPLAEEIKEPAEKTPGSVIVPCRARGMPMDHNFKTAYFVIPENVKHGEELICSYFACRNAGIKFRYCSHCKVPVAKRNFRKRHKHGGDVADKGDDSGGEDEVTKTGIPSQIMAGNEEETEADGISSQSGDSTNGQDEKKKATVASPARADLAQGLIRNSVVPTESSQRLAVAAQPEQADSAESTKIYEICPDRQAKWLSLLATRPSTQENETMSTWLLDVLSVSDLTSPHKEGASPDNPVMVDLLNATINGARGAPKESEKGANGTSKKKKGESDQHEAAHADGVVKKKRPANLLKDDIEESTGNSGKGDSYVSGSFAEWKERKKRKQSKGGSDVSGGSSHLEPV